MVSNRNPTAEGKRVVTTRVNYTGNYAVGGVTFTFREARNIRRVLDMREDPSAIKGAGSVHYIPLVIVSDGQGNTRLVQLYSLTFNTMAWAELGVVAITAINFVADLELAEGV